MGERSPASPVQRVEEALIPLWAVPGLLDYVCHRATKIERTSGTHESLTHVLMGALSGVPVVLNLGCEASASTALLSTLAVFAHEAVVIWDVGYAAPRRSVPPAEQHVHAFLEVLPFALLALDLAAYPAAYTRLATGWPLRLQRRRNGPPPAYIALVAGAGLAAACAFGEEFARCWRVDRTIAPHDVPPERRASEPSP